MIDSYSLLSMITTGILSVIVTRLLIKPRSIKACCMLSAVATAQRRRAGSS
jgi:hypothetical protein